MDVHAYLKRIDCDRPLEPSLAALRALHLAHLHHVPFENLDIPLGRRVGLSLDTLTDKVVRRRRGGFCYELNGLFAALLSALGFDVTLLAARVYGSDGQLGPDRDHLLLIVDLGARHLADVGFGDHALEPLRLSPEPQTQGDWVYRVTGDRTPAAGGGPHTVERRRTDGEGVWEPQYRFALTPNRLDAFVEMCRYHSTSPASHFSRKSVCTLPTPHGRVTLSNARFIETRGGKREERDVDGPETYRALLRTHFGIELEPDADIAALMRGTRLPFTETVARRTPYPGPKNGPRASARRDTEQ